MQQAFAVKAVTPMGRIVEFVMLAESERDAKVKATDIGLHSVIVHPAPPPPAPPPAAEHATEAE
jgi:hypothetical protein